MATAQDVQLAANIWEQGEIIPDKSVVIYFPAICDMCTHTAMVDGKTINGPWANLCLRHFNSHGVGLGAGKGQVLIWRKEYMSKWSKAKFLIATTAGKMEVDGETSGFFGIHGHAYNYAITHLPTGYSVSAVIPVGLKRTKKNLYKLVAKLEATGVEWNTTDLDQIKGYKEQVLAIRNDCKFGEF